MRKFSYTYDFGDNWEHEIIIENSRYLDPKLQSPIECLEGGRACPPEDIGGAPGYYEFCKALKDPNHEEHQSYTEWFAGFPWYDGVFESEKYEIGKVNYELMKYLHWSRNRCQLWEVSDF
ncbi:MAG: plasmid pRiA4b ORF-3 family protein [bacterium]